MPPELAPVVYGKYQLLQLLARGGMAEVFKAKSHGVEGFEKILVIKRILPELSRNPRFVEMFINEAKIAVTLSHANIVQVFDLGRADETYFIAMEYVAGYDLATVLRRGARYKRPLSQELAVFVVSELAKGLDYAHRRRDASLRPLHIVHRDVSPQNVLLSFEGEVKLTDFGIAKAKTIADDAADEGVLKGKYAYMSPEQARGENVDSRTDLYALGIVLFEALSGESPFQHESAYETLRRVREGDAPPLKTVVPDVPDELAAIVDRALAPQPELRHANAGRLYEDLVQFLYASGRRVGGHDLARYLQDLREVSQAHEQERDAARLRAMFDEEGSKGAYAPSATPVQVPFSRATRSGPSSSGSESQPRRGSTGVARPTAERRDVTVLVMRSESASFVADEVVERLARRYGGVRIDEPPRALDVPAVALLFGVRDPDGRDSESAARCALRLVRAAATGTQTGTPDVPVQVAIDCGRILVDLAGEPIRDEAFERLLDSTRTLASRAATRQVLVSPAAQRIIAGLFLTLPHGDGDDPPHLLEEERDLPDASGKFVGRREELRQMGEILALANRGKLKMLGLAGEAGVGKTRLLLETRRRLKLGGHDVGMYIATCARHGRTVPLSGITEIMRVVLGVDEFEPDHERDAKVGRLRELGLVQQDVAAIGAALGAGPLPEGSDPLVRALRPAIGRVALKLAQDRLTVFAFDSAESLDDESQMLLDALIRDGREARIAVVLAYRPGFVHGWQGAPTYHELTIGPMSDDDIARLTATRLAAEEVPIDLLREVTGKSAGNPLYVEEYVKALTDAGAVEVRSGRVIYRPDVAEVEVPKTLRGIVGARLSRLGVADRHFLQIAAVAGARFHAELVADVAGEEVTTVSEAFAVLEGRGLVARAGATELAFAHDLVGEVLREGLTLETRREIHGAVAASLERLHPQRLDELAERLASHWREAGDRAKAVEYLVRAGERMVSELAHEGAVQSFERAIDLLSQMAVPDRERMLALYKRIGELCWKARALERGITRMASGVELAEALDRRDWIARLSLLRGRLLVAAHRVDEGRRWLDRAGDIARQLDDRALFRDIVLATAESCMRLGDHRGGIHFFEQTLTLSRETGDVEAQVRCLVPLALAYSSTGNRQAALGALAEARRLTEARIDRFTECELLKMESLVHFFARDYAASIEVGERALELAKEYGFTYEAAVNAHNVGEAHLRLGDYKRAFASLRYSYELARDHGYESLMMGDMRILGFIDAMRFGSEEGRRHVVDANDFADARGLVWDLVQGRYYLAMIDQARGEPEEARAALREVLRLAAEHGHADYMQAAERALIALESSRPIPMPD
ncbi:serine/threonine-protein kinase PknK [Sandaracinus amylolyticus]|uniref:Serine/threonine protein kinase PrkC, regulator of stationary phase n=1 Tax=Sandaracinus amylolyticus TaxID=927083 RepID=A0A0F6W465_9BACT|nr:serine/threonine-protein kinase [Sandaracinus amylolyticus]AKF06840.1 Serine/threonine protein kinase PrkC, regulator of stationary phase [Sandaracinus amylolyticus]